MTELEIIMNDKREQIRLIKRHLDVSIPRTDQGVIGELIAESLIDAYALIANQQLATELQILDELKMLRLKIDELEKTLKGSK